MSTNQKQPAAGGPQTQRYSNAPYQPIISQHTNGSDAFHSTAGAYVTQTQGPNQGPGLRNLQSSRPPNQSSTPPNTDLSVTNLQAPISSMQFVPNPAGRAPPAPTFFQNRGAGVPPAQSTRIQNQQHRAQGPVYPSQYVMQPLYLPQQSLYYNQRPPSNIINPPSFTPPVYQQSFSGFQPFSSTVSSGVPAFPLYPIYSPQSGPIPLTRTSATPVTATPSNPTTGSISTAPLMTQPVAAQSTYSRNSRQRRSKAIPIIDPTTGQDKLDEIFENKSNSHPASGESSARQTPQPPNNNKEIQAAFAKQVAQAINEDKLCNSNVDQTPSLYEASSVEQFPGSSIPAQQISNPIRFDIQNSTLQCDAKEFISTSVLTTKDSTPIVSANSNAAEVILAKKEGESPSKTRKQGHRDTKPEILKEQQPKEAECDTSSSIVKEETNIVPQVIVDITQSPVVVELSQPEIKETVTKENIERKGAKGTGVSMPPEQKVYESESGSQSSGKSKNNRNKNIHHQNQNGKPQPAAPQPALQSTHQHPVVPIPTPQPPKSNNRSNKSKELNMKGANKEGTDMDAFNDNNPHKKEEINANIMHNYDAHKVVVSNDATNANLIPQVPVLMTTVVPSTLETDTICLTERIDANENVATIRPDTLVNSASVAITATIAGPNSTSKPTIKPFNVTSIIKDTAPKTIMPPFPIHDNRDETDRTVSNDTETLSKIDMNNKAPMESSLKDPRLITYKPGQWAPDCPDGKKVYDREFLLKLKNFPASLQKPDNIPDAILSDERNRQIDGRLSIGGRTDYTTPPFNSYGGKSGSQRGGTLPKRNSQSNKMGSRSGDKIPNKHQPKVTISISRDEVKLHEAENAWKPARLQKVETSAEGDKKTESLYKKVRSVLNKLTPQKFDTLVNQVRQLQIDNKERLQGVINLVFEKAIDEPNFSLAYAMMCKEIQNMQVSITSAGGEDKKLAFRTLLVTRCQQEFEKQSVDETQRNNKLKEIEECADAERKKELQFDLEEYDRRVRMKSVGCIRFIGELFKQQMLTASIMKRCLQTLLDNKDEESLECLCKLLTTVGKELESKNVDLVTIFDEMKRITDGKRQKVSSRIRFMLQDVIDLRDSKWIPRRGDTNPKTIDQIQKEAETEHLNIQVMNMNPPRKDDRGSGSRGGGSGSRQRMSEDGWNSVGARNNRQPFTFQADKIKGAFKPPQFDEPLGSSLLFGSWGKGATGTKSSQPPLNPSPNMYAALENIEAERRPPLNQRNKELYSSKGPSLERNYKNYDGRGSRSGSQHRDSTPMRSTVLSQPSAPPIGPSNLPQQKPHQSVVIPQPATILAPKLSEEQIERRIHNTLDEFITGCSTTTEYFQDIAAVVPQADFSKVIFESYNYLLEKSHTARLKTGELFATLIKTGHISEEHFLKGFEGLLSLWEDLVIDIPQIWQYFAEDVVWLLLEEVLSLARLQKLLDGIGIVKANVAKRLLKPLFSFAVKEKGPNFLQNIWHRSSLQLQDFMPSSDVQLFVQENSLEFLLGGDFPVGEGLLSYVEIQRKLSEFLQNKTPFDDIVNWISANVGNRVKENKFIRTLATAIFENSIVNNKLQPDVLLSHTKLIQKYADNNTQYELQCLYALQSLVHKLEHPQGLLFSICDKLYEYSTFCQESFIAWFQSKDPAENEGKAVALVQLTSFFTQLMENEEDDESSSNPEDA